MQQKHTSTRQRLLSLLLSTTVLATGMLGIYKQAKHVAYMQDPAVVEQLNISNQHYTLEQAVTRAQHNRDGKFTYPHRHETLPTLFEKCTQADYTQNQTPRGTEELHGNLQTLKNSKTAIGSEIADFSTKANIFHCYTLYEGLAGKWHDQDGTVRINYNQSYSSQSYDLLSQIHEVIHGMQRTTGVKKTYKNWSLKEYQDSTFAYESAARTGELIGAFELHLKGIRQPWQEVQKYYPTVSQQLENIYDEARKNGTHKEALTAAAKFVFYTPLEDQNWLDVYNNITLQYYIALLAYGSLDTPPDRPYSKDTLRKTGWLSESFNYTATLDKNPTEVARFGTNKEMEQAAAYIEHERIARVYGENYQPYRDSFKKLSEEKNPYLGLDIKEIAREIDKARRDSRITDPVQIMNEMAQKLAQQKTLQPAAPAMYF